VEVTQKMKTSLSLLFALFLSFSLLTRPSIAQPEPPAYLIGPNDTLNIHVWREDALTRDVTVMDDGRIAFPLIGEIMAQGKTIEGLKQIISQKLKKYVSAPNVTVIVKESRSRRIYTIGKLNTPGSYPLVAGMTVLQALSKAGGFTEWADTKNILVIRREGGMEERLLFNYKDFISGKEVEQNILLRPNDTIVVP
jgi:polysaccharide export outer membrane protein